MDKSEALDKVKQYSKLVRQHLDIETVYLFGSFANNTNRKDSDIDVAIVVKQMNDDFFTIHPLLWKLRRQIDDRIEPILIEKENDQSGFLIEIQRNGIEIL